MILLLIAVYTHYISFRLYCKQIIVAFLRISQYNIVVVMKQFGDEILAVTKDVLREFDVDQARVSVVDHGALECVLRARVECAVLRAKGEC